MQLLAKRHPAASALALIGLSCLWAPNALAACTDPARPGVDWNRCYHDGRNLGEVDLTGAKLRDARFSRTDLQNSILDQVDGRRAKFVSAMLKGVRFEGANLTEADFTKADLTGASFRNANLRGARLFRAILRGADLTGARLQAADLLRADLSGARWTDGETVCAEGSISQCK
jgi:uncharacterized protein YjbI with pentapeptide repeats